MSVKPLVVLAVALSLAAAQAAQAPQTTPAEPPQSPSFRVGVEIVSLNVTVSATRAGLTARGTLVKEDKGKR